jgi:hypothetical protein
MLPALSYSQSKSEKYPKQTVINGDTVVILSLSQANEMNQSFMEMQAKIDSINSIADTLQSVVINKDSENKTLQVELIQTENRLDKQHIRKQRFDTVGDVILGIGIFTTFLFITKHHMNQY